MEHTHSRSDGQRLVEQAEATRRPDVEFMSVIAVAFNRGIGCCEASPVRRVTAYYDTDGQLLAERDTLEIA